MSCRIWTNLSWVYYAGVPLVLIQPITYWLNNISSSLGTTRNDWLIFKSTIANVGFARLEREHCHNLGTLTADYSESPSGSSSSISEVKPIVMRRSNQFRHACEECHERKIRCKQRNIEDGCCEPCQDNGRRCLFALETKTGRPVRQRESAFLTKSSFVIDASGTPSVSESSSSNISSSSIINACKKNSLSTGRNVLT